MFISKMKNSKEILPQSRNRKLVTTAFLFLLQLILVSNGIDATSEIVTLQKQNLVKCITEDVTSPIYVSPPIIEDAKHNSSLVANGVWSDDDWLEEDESRSMLGSVTDKRWEDFETLYTRYQSFTGKTSVFVSIFTPAVIQVFMYDEDTADYVKIERNDSEGWTHLNVLLKNGNVQLIENNEVIRTTDNFVPKRIVIKTRTKTFWKRHKYQFKWADTITKEKPATLTVAPTPEKKCLMFYVSVCQGCFLDIFTSDNEQVPRVNQLNEDAQTMMTKSWQLRKVDIEPGTENVFRFYRGRQDDKEAGEWGIDFRWCPEIASNGKVIYEISSPDQQNRTCHLLEDPNGGVNRKNKMKTEESKTFNCEPGMLGKECDINCKYLLGPGNQYCQEHRICENSDCKCAWGFDCKRDCKSGYWGLSCGKKCDSKCKECNKVTGECTEFANISGIMEVYNISENNKYPIILGLVGVTLFLLLVVLLLLAKGNIFKKFDRKGYEPPSLSETKTKIEIIRIAK